MRILRHVDRGQTESGWYTSWMLADGSRVDTVCDIPDMTALQRLLSDKGQLRSYGVSLQEFDEYSRGFMTGIQSGGHESEYNPLA